MPKAGREGEEEGLHGSGVAFSSHLTGRQNLICFKFKETAARSNIANIAYKGLINLSPYVLLLHDYFVVLL
jgi:hypothetical protein